MRIVGVHGVGNYRTGETATEAARNLGQTWHSALARTADGAPLQVAVAYYADLLRPAARQGGTADLDNLDDLEIELLRAWLTELSPPEGVAAGRATWPLRQLIAWIARTRFPGRPGTEWFVATFFREVAAYLRATDNSVRATIRDHIAAVIAADTTDVVIAHSLGSVVAYETLWANPDLHIDTLVTLGSPLAIPHAVFPRLEPAPQEKRGCRPPGVRRWINLADPGDIVAIPIHGVGSNFDGVDIDEHTVIDAFDFHRVRKYLATARLAELIRL
jgi:hypothetical protein